MQRRGLRGASRLRLFAMLSWAGPGHCVAHHTKKAPVASPTMFAAGTISNARGRCTPSLSPSPRRMARMRNSVRTKWMRKNPQFRMSRSPMIAAVVCIVPQPLMRWLAPALHRRILALPLPARAKRYVPNGAALKPPFKCNKKVRPSGRLGLNG